MKTSTLQEAVPEDILACAALRTRFKEDMTRDEAEARLNGAGRGAFVLRRVSMLLSILN